MRYNYFIAKKVFERDWAKLAKSYAEAGMSSEAIQEMYNFDWAEFCRNRVNITHSADFSLEEREDIMEQIPVNYDIYGGHSRYWWLSELSTPCLTIGAKYLSDEDKELLTLYICEEYTVREIAELQSKSKSQIYRKLRRIFSLFESAV